VRHHRSVAYSVELVLLNKHQVYGGAPKLHWYLLDYWHARRIIPTPLLSGAQTPIYNTTLMWAQYMLSHGGTTVFLRQGYLWSEGGPTLSSGRPAG